MSLKQWYIRNFKRNQAVIIKVVDESGHFTSHWCIPERDRTVKVEGVKKAVVINRECMLLSTRWNVPTFVVHHSNCEVMSLDDTREKFYDSNELRLILDNDEAHKVYNATNNGKLTTESIIIIGVMVLGFLAMFYFFNTKLNSIDYKIPDPIPVVEEVSSNE